MDINYGLDKKIVINELYIINILIYLLNIILMYTI